jgi:hypothetical protein
MELMRVLLLGAVVNNAPPNRKTYKGDAESSYYPLWKFYVVKLEQHNRTQEGYGPMRTVF